MISRGRIVVIILIYLATSGAWMALGGSMLVRSEMQDSKLSNSVSELWGTHQVQRAPGLSFGWHRPRVEERTEEVNGKSVKVSAKTLEHVSKEVPLDSTQLDVQLDLDQRLKGLIWYSLYDVDFSGEWTYQHRESLAGKLVVDFGFPDPNGLYDEFTFVVNGQDMAANPLQSGRVVGEIPVAPGEAVHIQVHYVSRGRDNWEYRAASGVSTLENFVLNMKTNFSDIDFPPGTMSPSRIDNESNGKRLRWAFERVVTGQGIGMVMPARIQPGSMAAQLAFSAPVSLLFFFVILGVISVLREIDLHPINYLFLAAAFFSFHLLFAYSVDHIHIVTAFGLSALVSMFLVASYLRLVVSPAFAFKQAAGAQGIYLVGFSLAHFWEGYTGITVTVLGIFTLYVLMQLTAKVRWGQVFATSR